jgi:hypothetical protein
MSEMIAYCGLDCAECGAYKATVANDDELRKQTAKQWSEMFGADVKPEDVNCMGCKSDILMGYCSECKIRECGNSKAIGNCGVCSDFGCAQITEFLINAPVAKTNLEKIRNTL